MIELYHTPNCPSGREIEAALQELVVAHRVISVEPGRQPEALPPDTPLPALKENGQLISGQDAIQAHLEELARLVADWRRFQTDACYIDNEGEVC